ncbi:DNA repair protein RadC [Aquiflexum balticum DSM 16537]|uniref:DNA repair protein RadC n=1 Tax=Aquiflexum balticum DSM 16537 TaxID=758820 RepID=A0A1W2H8C5_9BACT|nr:JAB domain-containing protein [Aquiflexum balticum]SMD44846.1 DNA repair protein RadC [Aquiflexum balticum DSM 16537]
METSNISLSSQVAEIQLSYHPKVKLSACPKIACSRQAYSILLEGWDKDKIEFVEQFKVMVLNRANKVIGVLLLGTGSVAGVTIDVKLIMFTAIKCNASGIVISHNHPSGNLMPSKQDKLLTQKVKEAGEILDLPLLDHIIVTQEGFFSFADEGLL